MKRWSLLCLLSVTGCIDFEKAYQDHGRDLPSQDAGVDAGADAGAPDAGTADAGLVDAGLCTVLGCLSPVSLTALVRDQPPLADLTG
jgi:hypothetical protein